MEIIIRLGLKRYFESGTCDSELEAMTRTLEDHVNPYCQQYDVNKFRKEVYWNEYCDNVLKAYLPLMENVYNTYGGTHRKPGQKMFMTLDEFENFVVSAGMINDMLMARDISVLFSLSKFTEVNEIDSEKHLQMSFVEFLECFARCCDKASYDEKLREQYSGRHVQEEQKDQIQIKDSDSDEESEKSSLPLDPNQNSHTNLLGISSMPKPQIRPSSTASPSKKKTIDIKNPVLIARMKQPLHVKIKNVLPKIFQMCTKKVFKENFKEPQYDAERRLYLLSNGKYY